MKTVRFLFLAITAFAFVYETALCIPAFARKYDMSCTVCHAPAAPKLKPYGEEYAANGFQLPDKEPLRYFRDTGDDRLLLLREIPLAFRFEMRGYLDAKYWRWDTQSPYLLKLLSGGQIAKDIAYYFYFFLSEQGHTGIEDAFVMFNNVFDTGLDITIGQFQISDPLFKRELRLPLEDYRIYTTQVGKSDVTLKYDRGMMLSYGLPTSTDIILSIVNGNGIGPIQASSFDTDSYVHLMLRVSQDISQHLRLGAFGYSGKEVQPMFVTFEASQVRMMGSDATITLEPIELNLQYVYRSDSNPQFFTGGPKALTRGGFAEVIFALEADKSDWFLSGLYNIVLTRFIPERYETLACGFHYLPKRNVRFTVEAAQDLDDAYVIVRSAITFAF